MVKAVERREEIKALIEKDHGVHNLNYSELGKKYGVSHQVIAEDVKKVLSEGDKEEIDSRIAILEMASSKALKSAMRVLDTAKDNVTRLKASKIISDIAIRVLDRLERLGSTVGGVGKPETLFYEIVWGSRGFEEWCKENGYTDALSVIEKYREFKQQQAREKKQYTHLEDGKLPFKDFRSLVDDENGDDDDKDDNSSKKKKKIENKDDEDEEEAKLELVDEV